MTKIQLRSSKLRLSGQLGRPASMAKGPQEILPTRMQRVKPGEPAFAGLRDLLPGVAPFAVDLLVGQPPAVEDRQERVLRKLRHVDLRSCAAPSPPVPVRMTSRAAAAGEQRRNLAAAHDGTFRRWPYIVAVLGAIAFGGCGDSEKTTIVGASPKGQPPPAPVDSTTLFNSIAQVFIAKVNEGEPSTSRLALASDIVAHCDDGERGVHICEMRISLPVTTDESWVYEARLTKSCWIARTRDRFGANQDLVDAYRNRDVLAPSRAEVRRYIREADRVRVLRGCTSNVPRAIAGSAPAVFVAAFAKQNVQRERPGAQSATRCRYLGKQEISFAPDSWDFDCVTTMVSGKTYVDKLVCFDPPPYTSLDPCVEKDGYPKRPPRALP